MFPTPRPPLAATRRPVSGRGTLSRLFAGLWMVVHLLVVAAVPVADAHVPHADEIVAHWEDANHSDCPPAHFAEDCQICQVVVAARALPTAPTHPLSLAAGESRVPREFERVAAAATFLEGHSSRAPPLG